MRRSVTDWIAENSNKTILIVLNQLGGQIGLGVRENILSNLVIKGVEITDSRLIQNTLSNGTTIIWGTKNGDFSFDGIRIDRIFMLNSITIRDARKILDKLRDLVSLAFPPIIFFEA